MDEGQDLIDEPLALQKALSHVYWIGGSPCSGKTSIAQALIEGYGLSYYDCDHRFYDHNQIITPEKQPVFYRVMRLSSEDLWMRPVAQQTSEELEIYREEFPLIVQDLLALPPDRPVLAEGAALLPECVQALVKDPRRAIWVVPTAEFQLAHYRKRSWWMDVVKDTSDPEQAFQNWMERDIRFARHVRRQAEQLGLRALVVDGMQSIADNILTVETHFGLKP